MEIITSPIPNSTYKQTLYGITAAEAKIILPLVKREYNHAVKMVEHYKDATIDGYGTDRQTTALTKWEDKADVLACLLRDLVDNIL